MQPTFRYTTLAEVKARIPADLLTDSAFSDAAILGQIEEACAAINTWTRQVFQPVPETVRVNGRGSRIVTHPDVLPFLLLKQIADVTNREIGEYREMDRIIPGMRNFPESMRSQVRRGTNLTGGIYAIDAGVAGNEVGWERGSRTLSMISLLGGFSNGWNNVEMTGWWGALEGFKSVNVALDLAIPANATNITSIVCTQVQDADTGDFIEAGDTVAIEVATGELVPKRVEVALVKSITGTGPYTLAVDTLHPYPVVIPAGARVYSFGRVPRSLASVATFLSAKFVAQRIAEITGDAAASAAIEGTLRSERTDNYSYNLAASGDGGSADGASGKLTGSARMDSILKKFAQPAVAVRFL